MVTDKGEGNLRHTTFMTSKAGLTKEVVFHEGGLPKGIRLTQNHAKSCSHKNILQKTLGTRVSCEIGTGLSRVKGKMGIRLDEHRAIYVHT